MILIARRKTIQFFNRFLYSTNSSPGYVVLIPEIGEDCQFADNILNADELPKFNKITIENCLGAISQQTIAFENTVKEIANKHTDIDKIFEQLEVATAPLDVTWGVAKALYLGNSTLIPTKSYMNIHNRALNARASKFCNKDIFNAIKNEYQNFCDLKSDCQKKRMMEKYILESRLNGLELDENTKDELQKIVATLNSEKKTFKDKVDTAVKLFGHLIHDYNLVREFPMAFMESIAVDPNNSKKGPWKISLQAQIIEDFLIYCPDRTLRWNLWRANVQKCSTQLESSLETSTHIEKIRSLRKKQANILGFRSYTEMSMQTKMIKNITNVKALFKKLLESAGPAQLVEIENLQQFALERGFEKKLDIYDIPYWHRKYLHTKFDFDEDSVKQYFTLPKVIKELFTLSEEIFGIKIVQRNAEVWQPTVKYYDVFDCDINTTRPVGGFYLDCYSKENSCWKNSAWMASIRNRNNYAGNSPLCALIFNFKQTSDTMTSLLRPRELRTIFKTFGTAIQHLLTRADYSDLAGLSNIEWDASEVTGEVMANFVDDQEVLKRISSHSVTEDPIPCKLASNIALLKTNLAGYKLCEELYYSDLDLEMYESSEFWLDIVKKLWPIYRCMPLDKKDAHPCSMTEIFSGDWPAAYFSHLHSKVIAADVYDAFIDKKSTYSISEIGKRYKDTFLASGGSVATAEVFRRFRGRDPSPEAFLKYLKLSHTC